MEELYLKKIDAELRTNHSFRNKLNEELHLYTSNYVFLLLNIDMVYYFASDYMHCICLGVMKRFLLIWLGRDKMFNSRKYRISSTHELK